MCQEDVGADGLRLKYKIAVSAGRKSCLRTEVLAVQRAMETSSLRTELRGYRR